MTFSKVCGGSCVNYLNYYTVFVCFIYANKYYQSNLGFRLIKTIKV